jgi:hypothetical protein
MNRRTAATTNKTNAVISRHLSAMGICIFPAFFCSVGLPSLREEVHVTCQNEM